MKAKDKGSLKMADLAKVVAPAVRGAGRNLEGESWMADDWPGDVVDEVALS